jgi:hypothetical protein
MSSQIPGTVLTVVALAALAGYAPTVSDSAFATSSASSPQSSRSEDAAHERTAIHALGQARYAAQNRRPQQVIEQIERAETAMLNISQIALDPHIDTARQHMAAARSAVQRKNLRDAEAELAAATDDLTVTLALLTPNDVWECAMEKMGDTWKIDGVSRAPVNLHWSTCRNTAPRTAWWATQSSALESRAEFPANREFCRDFRKNNSFSIDAPGETRPFTAIFIGIPIPRIREFVSREHGKFLPTREQSAGRTL